MTLIDVQRQILEHFLNSDTFNLASDDIDSVQVDDELEEIKYYLIYQSLLNLDKLGLVKLIENIDSGKKELFILTKQLDDWPSQLEIPFSCAVEMSIAINKFLQEIGETDTMSDPMNISSIDIYTLLEMIQVMSEDQESKEIG